MLYLAIDQHKAQLTVNLRNEQGDIILKDQISTDHDALDDFFADLVKRAARHRGFMAILEVCGFNDWLVERLKKIRCKEIVVVQPERTSGKKTDRRDANALGELLWNNRKRFRDGARPNGIRRVVLPEPADAEIRQLANLRQFLVRRRTQVINKVRAILRKHNLEQDAPTKTFSTRKVRTWLETVALPVVDRIEIDVHLHLWKSHDEQVSTVEEKLARHAEKNPEMFRLLTVPGISATGAISLLSRIGNIERFPSPNSLANYFGLTPGCRNSGEATLRHGSITKAGNALARHILNVAVPHAIRKDKAMKLWHGKIKKRRGTKTANVAVMRKLATILWHILKRKTTYQFRYDPVNPVARSRSTPRGRFTRHDSGVQCTTKKKKDSCKKPLNRRSKTRA